MSEQEQPRDDSRRLVYLQSISDNLRIDAEEVDDFFDFGFGKEFDVNVGDVFGKDDVGILSLNRAESDVRVLDVGAVKRRRVSFR